MEMIMKKGGRPAKAKGVITPKGRRGRPKKSEEILDKRRTLRFTELYKRKKDKVAEPKKKYAYVNNIEKKTSLQQHPPLEITSQDLIQRNVRIEEGTQASSNVDSINKLENIKSPNEPPYGKGNNASPGRPLGSRNKSTVMLEAVGSENAVSVYKRLVELALAGDVTACKIILDRVYPVQKFRKISLEFEGSMDTIQDINTLSKHVLKLAVDGEISFDEAEECGRVLEQRMKNITDTEMAAKIDRTCEMVERIKRGE